MKFITPQLITRQRTMSQAMALGASFLLAALLLWGVGAAPATVFGLLWEGAFGSLYALAYVLRTLAPLLLVATGVMLTFYGGLWNIGADGQIAMGAIFTTGILRLLLDSALPPGLCILLGLGAGMLGGLVWALLVGALKTLGGVHEIFGGLGLNFVATGAAMWLIFGPWKRPGIASMSGTAIFPDKFFLPEAGFGPVSWAALACAILGLVLVGLLLKNTYFGLRLKALGHNPVAAHRFGVSAQAPILKAFALCGLLAGLAGALQVMAVYHQLIPSISCGYGFMALLVAWLAGGRLRWLIPIALFFAALTVGSVQLPMMLQLDSSFAGVLQGAVVLLALIAEGVRRRYAGGVS